MTNNPSHVPPIVKLSYKKGDLIIKQGDYGVSIYKILKGRVEVTQESEGREIPIAVLGPDDICGERTFLNRSAENRSASVRALEETEVEVWHTARLSREYDKMPPIIKYVVDQVMSRSIRMNNLIVKLSTKQQKEKAIREKQDPMASKRRFYRKKVDLPCRYRPASASSKFHLDGAISDISLDGLAMNVSNRNAIDVSHQKGDVFVVTTVLPNKKEVEMTAEIVAIKMGGDMTRGFQLGMKITDMGAATRKSLGFFLMP